MKMNIYFVVLPVNFTCTCIYNLTGTYFCNKIYTQKFENSNCSIILMVKMFVTSA